MLHYFKIGITTKITFTINNIKTRLLQNNLESSIYVSIALSSKPTFVIKSRSQVKKNLCKGSETMEGEALTIDVNEDCLRNSDVFII